MTWAETTEGEVGTAQLCLLQSAPLSREGVDDKGENSCGREGEHSVFGCFSLLHSQGREWMTKGKTPLGGKVSTQSLAASACFILKQGILQWVSSSLYLQQYVSEGKMNKNKQCKPFSGML